MWIPSHTTFETALNKSYAPSFWIANQLADKLAGAAANRHQIGGLQYRSLADSTQLAHTVLCRLVRVLSHLADRANYATVGDLAQVEPKIPRQQLISNIPKEAGHALDAHFKCVKCQLQLNMSRSLNYPPHEVFRGSFY